MSLPSCGPDRTYPERSAEIRGCVPLKSRSGTSGCASEPTEPGRTAEIGVVGMVNGFVIINSKGLEKGNRRLWRGIVGTRDACKCVYHKEGRSGLCLQIGEAAWTAEAQAVRPRTRLRFPVPVLLRYLYGRKPIYTVLWVFRNIPFPHVSSACDAKWSYSNREFCALNRVNEFSYLYEFHVFRFNIDRCTSACKR